MATPKPNEWNPNTTTVYSTAGNPKEIPIGDYENFISQGWGATAPSTSTPTSLQPEPMQTSTPAIPTSITPEQLVPAELPQTEQPYKPIQDVFGQDWKPAPIFEQLGLTGQGVYGAVRISGMNDVYTIGEGGRKETAESYNERFKTNEQQGIVGEISIEQAKKLGINIEVDTLTSDISGKLPDSLTTGMTPEQKAQVGFDILSAAEIKYGVSDLKKTKDEATQKLIDVISGMWGKFTEAKEEEREKLKMEEKSKAIADAQTTYTKVKSVYDKYINELTYSTMTTSHIGGAQAQARSQMAVELAPLATAIQIAQGNYDRAKEMLDDFSDDWKTAQEWNMKAVEMKLNMFGEDLTEAQENARFEAQQKLDWFREDYNRKLETIEEVKKLSLVYPKAGITISDSWEDAYRKIAPFIQSEKDFETKMNELDMKLKQKSLLGGGGSGGGGGYITTDTGEIDISTVQGIADALSSGQSSAELRVELNKKYEVNSVNALIKQGTQLFIATQLENSRGDDNFVNTALYTELKQKYPDEFKPFTTPEAIKEFLNPNDLTAQAIKGVEPPEDDFFQSLVKYFAEDKDLGISRKDVEKREKGKLTAEHIKALDIVYGKDRSFWKDLGTVTNWLNPLK